MLLVGSAPVELQATLSGAHGVTANAHRCQPLETTLCGATVVASPLQPSLMVGAGCVCAPRSGAEEDVATVRTQLYKCLAGAMVFRELSAPHSAPRKTRGATLEPRARRAMAQHAAARGARVFGEAYAPARWRPAESPRASAVATAPLNTRRLQVNRRPPADPRS